MSDRLLLYGVNGYTGDLIAREAHTRGINPILAGRNGAAVKRLADELKLEHRVFSLDERGPLKAGLAGVRAVLHCAGPYSHTAKPMADACLGARVHYLDLTGEIAVFEALAARDAEAKQAGVMLLPGSGFDVVPSDCLAAHVKSRLPTATHLVLAFLALGQPSRGTATTAVEGLHLGAWVRREGVLAPVPIASRTREFDFGEGGRRGAMIIPWGDVSTAFHSTGIPNIEVYMAAPAALRMAARVTRYTGWLLGSGVAQRFLKNRVRSGAAGPSAEDRARGKGFLVAEASDGTRKVVSRLRTPDGYVLTVTASLAIAQRVLAGDAPVGFQTPAMAYGADFVTTLEGCTRSDVA